MVNQKIICPICKVEFDDKKHPYKAHKIRYADFIMKYFPRYDLLDGQQIVYKSDEQYVLTDFNNRINLKKWLKSQKADDVKIYIKDLLIKRKNIKDIKYSLGQVELRTLIMPPVNFYHAVFGNYYKLCEELGFVNKFSEYPNGNIDVDLKYIQDDPQHSIFIDTREQSILKIDYPIEVKKLDFGDYTLSNSEDCSNIYIERKSLTDLIGTLSSNGYERFKNEIERAFLNDAYLIVLVEEKLQNALSFNHLPWISRQIKVTPEYIMHQMRELLQTYTNLQFLFVDGRKEAAGMVKKILFTNGIFKKIDLQLAYDLNII